MRGSWYVAGPLIARLGRAEVPQPGGCAIGSRPVEYVTSQFGRLGVRTEERTDVMVLSADDGMRGATCVLDPTFRSPGATFNVAMAAVMARGRTVIEHASADPEVESFCRFLQACGAEIDGVGTERLVIEGRPRLHGCTHRIISDRIEAGTYLIAGAATRGAVRVAPVAPWHLGSLLDIMEGMGLDVSREDDAIAVRWVGRPRGAVVFTEPFPGFPTDLQPPMVALMCLADGQSEMHERIYDGRLAYVHELRRMGAQVRLMDSRRALISGVEGLQGTEVEGADMRAGAALVLAALAAEGESRVGGRHYVLRGYQDLEEKLIRLGARICVEATP
jgi:UDP-N-acetylglucosamine 1-carboxyvinyltransferase